MTGPTWRVVGLTGPRPWEYRGDDADWTRTTLGDVAQALRIDHGCEVGSSGLALGTDTWWAIALLHAGLDLWAHIPFVEQTTGWHADDKRQWRQLVAAATHAKTYGRLGSVRTAEERKLMATRFNHARNQGMVKTADALVVVRYEDIVDGGTAETHIYARNHDKPIILIDPTARTIGWPKPPEFEQLTLI